MSLILDTSLNIICISVFNKCQTGNTPFIKLSTFIHAIIYLLSQ